MATIITLLLAPLIYAKDYLKAIWRIVSAVGVLMLTLGAILWPFLSSAQGLVAVADKIDALAATIAGMPISPYMAVLNRIFPLEESLALLAFLYGTKIVCMLLRWVRSFIPTMGG